MALLLPLSVTHTLTYLTLDLDPSPASEVEGEDMDGMDGDSEDAKLPSSGSTSSEPYTSDLEYLEDGFAVVIQRIRRFTTSMSDDSDIYTMQRKKPEAILRELEAKERLARVKWDRRMDKTREAQGEGSASDTQHDPCMSPGYGVLQPSPQGWSS